MRRGWRKGQLARLWSLCIGLSGALGLAPITGCLSHTRKLQSVTPPSVVKDASAEQLVANVNQAYVAIHSLSATVDLQASVGGTHKGVVTDYTSFRSFILLEKPQMLRVLGLVPVIRTQAFDLVSDGTNFKLLIPSKNQAVEGKNTVTTKSPNTLMNLRPNLFFDAMLIRGIGPEDQVFLTTDSNVSQNPKTKKWVEERDYLLSIVEEKERGKDPSKGPNTVRELIPKRVIRFNRENLQPIEQDSYDEDGNIETQTFYGPLQTFGENKFPGTVTIKRPLEEYQMVLTVQKLVLNQPLANDQFELKIPDGVVVKTVD